MIRRLLIVLGAAIVLALLVPIVLPPRQPYVEPIAPHLPGDVEETVRRLGAEQLLAEARSLLATDRSWRAARTLQRYLELAPDPPDAHRVLAARAEAGWGGWPEARTLLERVPALETYDGGIGLYLLGRARDEAGETDGAVAAYRDFLALPAGGDALSTQRSAARLRLGLALTRQGEVEEGEAQLEGLAIAGSPWLRILRAEALAATGDTAAVRTAVAGFDEGVPGLRARRARVEAAVRAGDLAGARSLANAARSWARTTDTRAELLLLAGRIALRMGDVAAARDAFRGVVERRAGSAHAREAARLLAEGDMTPADRLAVARVQAAQGLHAEAVDGFERWLEEGAGSAAERARVHMEHATALFYAERYGEVAGALEPISDQTSARMLRARAAAHDGATEEAARLYLDIARDRHGTGAGASALFLAAGTLHDAGMVGRAVELYQRVVSDYPGTGWMGLALMRLAGIAFEREQYAEAVRFWDRYRARYPRGDRTLQATYWAGRARLAEGDSAGARALFEEVRERDRDSYYALLASERLGEPFWPLPMEPSPAPTAEAARRVGEWMAEVDLLREAGFEAAASALADDLVGDVGRDRPTRYALAEALAQRGYARRGILLGIGLQGSGPPNPRLLRILYPFPYRALITAEARDRDLDPFVAAALIRQESMFEKLATSPAGARGLMQIMPATGARLAEAAGMDRWDAELLYHPEINVHLGIRFVAQHMETYEGSLPAVFSAYNAGTHRVEWWSEYPEYGQEELFTERIPYRETRDYVKILTRNRALYAGLYGND